MHRQVLHKLRLHVQVSLPVPNSNIANHLHTLQSVESMRLNLNPSIKRHGSGQSLQAPITGGLIPTLTHCFGALEKSSKSNMPHGFQNARKPLNTTAALSIFGTVPISNKCLRDATVDQRQRAFLRCFLLFLTYSTEMHCILLHIL